MLEQSLITHCAPTLAGLKTAGLFCFSYTSESMLQAELRRCRLALGNKGVRIRVLRRHRGRALLYVYRPAKLRQDFQKPGVAPFLQRMGYALQPEIALGQLEQRLARRPGCPHEIGLFLGYPPEDVAGFVRHRGKGCKCVGCWKVYGDEVAARRQFAAFKACTANYCRRRAKGASLARLAVTTRLPQ